MRKDFFAIAQTLINIKKFILNPDAKNVGDCWCRRKRAEPISWSPGSIRVAIINAVYYPVMLGLQKQHQFLPLITAWRKVNEREKQVIRSMHSGYSPRLRNQKAGVQISALTQLSCLSDLR